jgi:hypothetical protein
VRVAQRRDERPLWPSHQYISYCAKPSTKRSYGTSRICRQLPELFCIQLNLSRLLRVEASVVGAEGAYPRGLLAAEHLPGLLEIALVNSVGIRIVPRQRRSVHLRQNRRAIRSLWASILGGLRLSTKHGASLKLRAHVPRFPSRPGRLLAQIAALPRNQTSDPRGLFSSARTSG